VFSCEGIAWQLVKLADQAGIDGLVRVTMMTSDEMSLKRVDNPETFCLVSFNLLICLAGMVAEVQFNVGETDYIFTK
jgi:hypothetical protein